MLTFSSLRSTAYVRSQSSWHHIGDSKVTAIDPSVLQTPQAVSYAHTICICGAPLLTSAFLAPQGKSSYVLYLRLR